MPNVILLKKRNHTPYRAHPDRVVEPIEGWDHYLARRWGENSSMIDIWFNEGETLAEHLLEDLSGKFALA